MPEDIDKILSEVAFEEEKEIPDWAQKQQWWTDT